MFCLSAHLLLDNWILLALVNNAAMNMSVQISLFETLYSVLMDVYPEVGLLDHMVILFLIF